MSLQGRSHKCFQLAVEVRWFKEPLLLASDLYMQPSSCSSCQSPSTGQRSSGQGFLKHHVLLVQCLHHATGECGKVAFGGSLSLSLSSLFSLSLSLSLSLS